MTRVKDISYYHIKNIKNHYLLVSDKIIHCLTIVYINQLEQFVCFNEEDFIIFWAHYKKVI